MNTRGRKGVTPPMDLKTMMGAVMSGEELPVSRPVNVELDVPITHERGLAIGSKSPPLDSSTVAGSTIVRPSSEARQHGKARQKGNIYEEQGNPLIIKQFQLRLSEPLKYKLEWVTKNLLHTSAHAFIVDLLENHLNSEIKKASARKH